MSHPPRSHQRYPLHLAATATVDGVAIAGHLQNLSVSGAHFVWEAPPSTRLGIDRRIELAFLIPQPETVGIATTVTVRWTAENGVGVRFDGLRAREAFALGNFLALLPAATDNEPT